MLKIRSLDHLVLTVASIEQSVEFYCALGMEHTVFGDNRHALSYGSQKINLHQHKHEFEPKAFSPTPGSGDLCFIVDTPIEQVIEHLKQLDLIIEEGPIKRTGACGPIVSIYIRDPDKNLIELSNYLNL